jgi:2-polyprenyl-6-methoxyphenol hydroxylase-like FAD-dependent oxidoreductase
LREDIVGRGVQVKRFELRRMDGRVLKRMDLRRDAMQSIVLLRPALHGRLLETVGSHALQTGRRVDDPSSIDADVIVGADGVASAVRRTLHPAEPPPRPSGYHALRGVSHDVVDRLGTADGAVYMGDAVEIGVLRASPSAVYWYISLLDELAGGDACAVRERCTRGLDDAAAGIARAAAAGDMRLEPLFYRHPIANWGRGRVTLLGDAAHPVLPHTAQGAALALEDAVALGLALRGGDVEEDLRRYERVRSARTRSVVKAGPRMAAMTTTRSALRTAARAALVRLVPAASLSMMLSRYARDPHRALRRPAAGNPAISG